MKRLFVLTIKYIPIIQLIGMLINNSLYTYDIKDAGSGKVWNYFKDI